MSPEFGAVHLNSNPPGSSFNHILRLYLLERSTTMAPLNRTEPLQISLPLPGDAQTTIHAHVTFSPTNSLIFLTAVAIGDSVPPPLGSFVYAMPNASICLALSCHWRPS